jgi:hypothetical protein
VNSSEPAKVIASIFALAAFAVAIVAGLAAGNTPARVLGTAVGAMVVCQVLGQLVGAVGEWVVNEHVTSERNRHAAESSVARPAAAPAQS